jgi:alkylated DNA repair dioxygenase AlkB
VFSLIIWKNVNTVSALSSTSPKRSLVSELQRCFTPKSILEDVGRHLHPEIDPQGTLSSLILVRLSKQLINRGNCGDDWGDDDISWNLLRNIVQTLASARWRSSARALDAAVEGTKAASVMSRLLKNDVSVETWEPLLGQWHQEADRIASELEPHHLSGLKFSLDCFQLLDNELFLPSEIQKEYDLLNLPFRVRPASFQDLHSLTVSELVRQVDFEVDDIRTTSNRVIKERRQTAWEGDSHVAPFAYSGKSMKKKPWSPLVLDVRDRLHQQTGEYYDGCLLNLYPDGGSGMRFHIDPDQGTLWGYETAVVSVGATRRFAFRDIPNDQNRDVNTHVFTLMHGDVTEMFEDCQKRLQHTVKTAEAKNEMSSRASLVFKKTLPSSRAHD